MVITRIWLKHLLIVLAHTGVMAWFEKAEFGYDELIQPWFPQWDKTQKGNYDTMYDLLVADPGLLTAYALRGAWNFVYALAMPGNAKREYLAHLAELSSWTRAQSKELAVEYRRHRKEERRIRRGEILRKIRASRPRLSGDLRAVRIPGRQKKQP